VGRPPGIYVHIYSNRVFCGGHKRKMMKLRMQNAECRMRVRIYHYCAICVLACLLCFKNSYCQPISSTELINHAAQYDGKTVIYEGEVIGEVMLRGDYAWININDSKNALGIWISASLAREINYAGNYKSKGDVVEVTGIFHRACPEHGGDLDIHAQSLRKISPGRTYQEKLNPGKRDFVIVLFAILCLVWILTLFKHK
jgi:hypothetical protein